MYNKLLFAQNFAFVKNFHVSYLKPFLCQPQDYHHVLNGRFTVDATQAFLLL